ncbi:hypothetical protein OSB04_024115 [Centaurea solstitialis]|uniref:Uncharacterized protein n=1 Tax=Centaurea solstitialis TaxID=347529 RepID=A0AA38SL46_9ASTR|nr:hypothetical protein OSB04_024115 [Centaurea solstitialis]
MKNAEENYCRRLKIIQVIINKTSVRHARRSDFPKSSSPSIPATRTTPEFPEHFESKAITNLSEEDKVLVDLGYKCKRLLIMAIPHEIFKNVDHCYLSKDILAELERQIEGF